MKIELTKERILKMAETCPTVKNALKAGFPEVFEEEQVYKKGDRFSPVGTSFDYDQYILAMCGTNRYVMISLNDGNLWEDPIEITGQIKSEHITKMFAGRNWKKIN